MPLSNKPEEDLSVTRWLSDLKEGDPLAAQRLWGFLQQRLQQVSKTAVRRRSAAYDEEDVAQSAFISLCAALQEGRYQQLTDRDELWKLLAVIVVNKAKNRAISESRLRRGGGKVISSDDEELRNIACSNLSAEEQMMMGEECAKLMGSLQRDELRHVAVLKVEGLSNEAVAEQLGCSRRSVQRRLNLIREIWSRQIP